MDAIAKRLPALLYNGIGRTTQLSVRFKGIQKPHKVSWKPIPPKPRRDAYYIEHKSTPWSQVLIKYNELLEARKSLPPPEPSEMHVVTRVKPLRGVPKDLKALCEHFNIHEKRHNPVVIANTSSNNELLMMIKHLIRVKPLTTPQGLPEHPSDLYNTQLRTDGSLAIVKRIEPGIPEKPIRLLSRDTLRRKNKNDVITNRILAEHVKTKYTWKNNEDGEEFTYKPSRGGW